ncbi:unnamed protein product [Vitrella brassicaformis CCMP3155]|uniref:Succinate-semialdehyde dehydrogenase n=1 Tax=Vitrella brassicaformis (strain CCMP3155) TaxID=1169540 RepID=A0A0G4EKX2_VITBC|nr:unnamed protein product [Vitrella brassicaformis CCMP3155]|eukprot:CEL98040.1 unnamed protein product [Vitrella brassicaformis CCMP3155]
MANEAAGPSFEPGDLQLGYINGEWRAARSGKTFDVKDPATGEVLGSVASMGREDTADAVSAAEAAFKHWRDTTPKHRGALLYKWYELMMGRKDELARLMTLENGKPIKEAVGEITYAANYIEWFAEEARRAYGHVIPAPQADRRIVVLKHPVGVCGIITPWNFPSAMITRKVAAALAAGCTVVCKPPELTPYSALALAKLAEQAGIPRGVINMVPCGHDQTPRVGEELCTSQKVRKISFTGSTAVGKLLMQQAASTVKKISLELGGNAPFIVFEDADLDNAVASAVACKFRGGGQTCVCANRFFVHKAVFEPFAQRLTEAVNQLKMGHGLDEGVSVGPMINQQGVDKVIRLRQDAISKGAKVLCGGSSRQPPTLDDPRLAKGTFVEPSVLDCRDLSAPADLQQEEIFGPLAALFAFEDEQDVIQQANNVPVGLAGYFFTRDVTRVWRVAERLEYGMVAVNTGILSTVEAPFGGIKESGIGREGSSYGMEDYQELKYVCMGDMGDMT